LIINREIFENFNQEFRIRIENLGDALLSKAGVELSVGINSG